ncbi:MAG: DNA adenine methylase [Ktedonobacterales bacterium]|nr:DNA adenine methylase [Ktedonobacterales bacterium]
MVEEIVGSCTQDEVVLDPFCGTGTTALVCAQQGVVCHTVDINPFLVWLANVKCHVYSQEDVTDVETTLHAAFATSGEAPVSEWTPPLFAISKWWEPATLDDLARVWARIREATIRDGARDLLKVIFCRVAIECAAVSFGHQSMSFKRHSAHADAPVLLDTPAIPLETVFWRVADTILHCAATPLTATENQAFLGDARTLSAALPRVGYTLVVTSPPYPNRMSYIRELRPYMYWLGYLSSGRQAGELDWHAIGGTWGCATSNLMSWKPDAAISVPHDTFHETVAQITAHSKILGTYVAKYFQDVVRHVQSLRDVLAPKARIHYVIGNSKFYDVMLHTEQIYAAIFEAQGFHDINIRAIRKRTSKKELVEYVVSASMS